MGDKKRWNDPANEGQVDYKKIGVRMFALIMLVAFAAAIKIGIRDNWFEGLRGIFG